MRRMLVPAIATLLSPFAFGQDTATGDPPEVPRYTVEAIIFRYAEEVSVGTERFLPDMPVVEEFGGEPADDLIFGDRITAPAPVEQPPGPAPSDDDFVLHFEDEYTLGDLASRLERLDVYEPIMHFAWTQETRPEEETEAIDLESLGPAPESLSGSFKLYLSRYLHLVVDLTLNAPPAAGDPVAIDESVISYNDTRSGYAFGEADPGIVRFRIREDRIFKNGDLRYFDHPKFGILAKITRVEEEAYDVEPELLGDDPATLPGGVNQ